MRLLICAGGTGGGVYPALSVLKQLMSMQPDSATVIAEAGNQTSPEEFQVLWVGGIGGMEADLVKREGVRFEDIPAAGLHGVGMRTLPGNAWQLARGFLASRRILRKFQPQVLFFTGGYVAVPMALAARMARQIKSLLYTPDIEPGQAIQMTARYCDCLALTVEESGEFFPNHPRKVITGYPLRPDLQHWSVTEARSFFALQDQLPVLMVFGGSRGARSINQALAGVLPELLKEMQIIHITGKLDWQMMDDVRQELTTEQLNRYRPYPYLYDEIGAAMRLADLVVTRAGASTLGELPLFGLPAILVPYPYAWRYQRVNASYLARHGAAVVLDDEKLKDELSGKVLELMHDHAKREQMSEAMRSLAHPEASEKIADLIIALGKSAVGKTNTYVPNPSE
jgi:UDP-N-acetylglucosamine--N-acetylmuramyl-(pentapeptide) pyrophosphoryl-undecaprenol N-acetylglucosamine transferase